jgi:nitrogenase iron protein NifH
MSAGLLANRMERIAVYGKGGIGKSVIATALSSALAISGKRVLHVGCDPKHDSAIRLLDNGRSPPTVLDVLSRTKGSINAQEVLCLGRHGIICCESGGPEPGVGCGGRGVAKTLEFLEEAEVIAPDRFDAVIFDVLGDVVCGGFAAPLRQGFAQKVLIVISEEPMALFAANNICRAVTNYAENDVCLAGFVANSRHPDAKSNLLERFTNRVGTRLLATIPRDAAVTEAECVPTTIVDFAPLSKAACAIVELANALCLIDATLAPLPRPLSESEFFDFMKEHG